MCERILGNVKKYVGLGWSEGKVPVWGVLQGGAGCCRVLQGVAGWCRALQCVAG